MSAQWKLDQQYADVMQNHPYGIALYRPLRFSIFNPGSCGYFDDNGSWNPIVHLEDREMLARKGLSEMEDEIEKAPVDSGIKWGPLTSENTRATKVELSGGIDPAPGIPVSASAVYSYSTDKNVGAVLLTSNPITHTHYYHASPFKNWCKKNALAILQRWPEVKEHGIWVVTSTHSTKKCAINMWSGRGRGFKVGFDADVAGIGKAGPNGEWYRSQTDEGWGEYTTEGDDMSVVFFGGLKLQYTWRFGTHLQPTKTDKLRGDEDEFRDVIAVVPDPENDQASFEVDCEEYLAGDGEADDET